MTGVVVWLTGLPASGKSTLAARVHQRLRDSGLPACILDSDAIREALRPNPGYSDEARDAFYATLGQLAALLAAQGLVVLVPATAHLRVFRTRARRIAPRFVEVHVTTPLEECARRDAKGLYAQARRGLVTELPGMDVPYEPPAEPEVTATGGEDEGAIERIVSLIDV